MNINIRLETEEDYRTVEEITREAFWNQYFPGCDEHYTAHVLRTHPDFIHDMDFVAELSGKVVGNIMYTKSYLVDEDNKKTETLTFGPLCVLPQYQRKGIGNTLIKHTVNIARKKGYKAIIILGDPHNYCKHGFKNCKDYLVSNSDGKYPYGQLVLELEKDFFGDKKWKFYYSKGYEINPDESQKFDKTFPEKEKLYKPSQEIFGMAVRAFIE